MIVYIVYFVTLCQLRCAYRIL